MTLPPTSCDPHPKTQPGAGGHGNGPLPPSLILSCIIHEFTATGINFYLRFGVVWAQFQDGKET